MSKVYKNIDVESITVTERLRSIDQGWVEALSQMIKDCGLKQPVEVIKTDEGYRLVAGAHRLAAVQLLKWPFIAARILDVGSDYAAAEIRLQEIVENIGRRELNALDRAIHLAEMKRVYEELYPVAGHGGARKKAKSQAIDNKDDFQVAHSATCFEKRFSESAREAVGLSDRSIRISIAIYNGLSPETRVRVDGTYLAESQADLSKLTREDHETQSKALDLLFSEPPEAETLDHALEIVKTGGVRIETPSDKAFTRLLGRYARLSHSQKDVLFDYMESDIRRWAQDKGWID